MALKFKLFCAALAVVAIGVSLRLTTSCEVATGPSHMSPDQAWIAIERVERCGSALGNLEEIVDLQPASSPAERPTTIWRAHFSAVTPTVVRWHDDRTLEISYSSGTGIIDSHDESHGISIRYRPR